MPGCKGGAGGTADVHPVGLPLVAHHQGGGAISVGQRVGCSEGLALRWRAAHHDTASGCIVGVGHRSGGAAGLALGGSKGVGVTGLDGNRLTDLGLAQGEGTTGGAGDVHPVGLPLVVHYQCGRAVFIGQRVRSS